MLVVELAGVSIRPSVAVSVNVSVRVRPSVAVSASGGVS